MLNTVKSHLLPLRFSTFGLAWMKRSHKKLFEKKIEQTKRFFFQIPIDKKRSDQKLIA